MGLTLSIIDKVFDKTIRLFVWTSLGIALLSGPLFKLFGLDLVNEGSPEAAFFNYYMGMVFLCLFLNFCFGGIMHFRGWGNFSNALAIMFMGIGFFILGLGILLTSKVGFFPIYLLVNFGILSLVFFYNYKKVSRDLKNEKIKLKPLEKNKRRPSIYCQSLNCRKEIKKGMVFMLENEFYHDKESCKESAKYLHPEKEGNFIMINCSIAKEMVRNSEEGKYFYTRPKRGNISYSGRLD